MSRHISQLRKYADGRGLGHAADYKPWITIDEFNSTGTGSGYPDPIHGRSIQVLSQGELRAYLILRWQDIVKDIREQYPLELFRTISIARQHGFIHPRNGSEYSVMTTDFLVDLVDGKRIAISCKPNADNLTKRDNEKLFIEKTYWEDMGTNWYLFETDMIPRTYARNILDVFQYYDEKKVHDSFSKAKHLVATKQLIIDMNDVIDWKAVIRGYNL